MIWRWRICFSSSRGSPSKGGAGGFACLLSFLLLVFPAAAATVSGRVELSNSKEPGAGKDRSGVVVWLEAPAGMVPASPPASHARMLQKNKTFLPHVLAIPVGTTVDFPNLDPIFHSAFSNYNGQIFDIGLYPPGSSRGVRFTRPGVVRVFCNIHATMSAVIVVLATPYFATSRKDGGFEIDGVPPGEYQLRVFHERAAAATLEKLERRIVVDEKPLTLPAIGISESGYLAIPHKNKYGRAYAPAPDELGVYPAVKR